MGVNLPYVNRYSQTMDRLPLSIGSLSMSWVIWWRVERTTIQFTKTKEKLDYFLDDGFDCVPLAFWYRFSLNLTSWRGSTALFILEFFFYISLLYPINNKTYSQKYILYIHPVFFSLFVVLKVMEHQSERCWPMTSFVCTIHFPITLLATRRYRFILFLYSTAIRIFLSPHFVVHLNRFFSEY